MFKFQRPIALLLCAALLLGLAACAGTPADTQPPTTEPPVTEAPSLTPAGLYREAVAALGNAPGLTLSITSELTNTVAGRDICESAKQMLSYRAADGGMQLVSDEYVYYNDAYQAHYNEAYVGGTFYTELDNDTDYRFCQEMDPETARARYLPAALLNADLYGSIERDGNELTFSEPTAAESWAMPADAELISAEGTAKLSADGELTETAYSIAYTYGAAHIEATFTVLISPAPDSIATPEDTAAYVLLTDIDALRLSEQAAYYLLLSDAVSLSSLESVFTQAGGVIRNKATTTNYDATTGQTLAKIDYSVYLMDYSSGQSQEYKETSLYRDGTFTVSADGGDPEPLDITEDFLISYCQDEMMSLLIDMRFWADATVTILDSAYLVECTLNEESADYRRENICADFFGDANLLDNLASSYRTNEISAYFAIDRFTGMPTAAGTLYEGVHTIDGTPYTISLQSDMSINVPALETYHEITDEYLPEDKPDERAAPLFYHVTGEGGEEMWLLGTIHVGDSRTAYLPQEIYDAFDDADALALEFNASAFDEQCESDDALQEQVQSCYFYSNGTTVQNHIKDAELYAAALQMLKVSGNYNANSLYLKPSLWSNSINNFYLQQGSALIGERGVDSRLERLAREQNKKVLDVESGLFQIRMMTGYSDALQEMLLADSLNTNTPSYCAGTQELYDLWCQGDEAALRDALTDDLSELTDEELFLYNEYNNAMLIDRNAGMLDVAISYLNSGETVFFAVGLAHLLTGNGLVDTLREAGYAVELVTFAE